MNYKSLTKKGALAPFLIILSFLVIFSCPRRLWVDGEIRFEDLTRLLETGELSKNSYSLIGPLFSSPLWFLGKWIETPDFWCVSYNLILFLIANFLFFRVFRRAFSRQFAQNFCLILFLGSMFPEHLKNYYSEVFTSLAVAYGFMLTELQSGTKGWWVAAVGVANAPATVVGYLTANARYCLARSRLRYAYLACFPVMIICAENWIRRGSFFTSGYEGARGPSSILPYAGKPGFSYPFVFGVLSILFSFGKGIFFYAPGLLLPVKKHLGANPIFSRVYSLWIAFIVGLVIVYAKWWAWSGDVFWGPRFFLFASIPATFALVLNLEKSKSLKEIAFTFFVLTWSFWVGLDSTSLGRSNMEVCSQDPNFSHLCWYVPEFSALFRPFVVLRPLNLRDYFIFTGCALSYLYLAFPLVKKLFKELRKEVSNLKIQF